MSNSDDLNVPDVAFYYPGPMWQSGDWIKNLILFFDGVALLVPEYMRHLPRRRDAHIAAGLEEHGLLHILEPERLVDKAATEQLAEAFTDLIAAGALDNLTIDTHAFETISMSRMGGHSDPALARMIFGELRARGLAGETEDGVSIPMHPAVRATILTLLAQILRPYGQAIGLSLSPATDRIEAINALEQVLSIPNLPSAGNVVAFDLSVVSVDVGSFPLDEVLDFRRQHLSEHRNYARSIRVFARELSMMPGPERMNAFDDRQAELDDLAHDLKRASRKAWKRPATFALSVAGAAWTATTGDPIGALIGAGSTILGGVGKEGAIPAAYSYLFRAHERFR